MLGMGSRRDALRWDDKGKAVVDMLWGGWEGTLLAQL